MKKEPVLEVDEEDTKRWFIDGKLHRLGGPAVIWANGQKEWWIDGKPHRLDGPAIDSVDGIKIWYVNGELHRLDGPAVEWVNGNKSWYINDKKLTEEAFNRHPAVLLYKQKQQIKKDLASNKEIDDDTRKDMESVLLDL